MIGLTTIGFKDRILRQDYTLTEAEAIDLFLMYPTLVQIDRIKGSIKLVRVSGLNLDFKIRK